MHLAGGTEPHQEHLASLMTNGQPMTKLDLNDGRIIPFGMLIRAMALDELPQLFNILRGEMSLVGPRPCLSYEQQRFKAEHAARFDGMPGLTGLWQVSGKNETTFQEMIRLDVEYIRTLSLWRDLRILVLTLPVLISQTAVVLQNKWQRVTKARRHGMRCN
jgi:lipopolysaccharide/colanic/teichoic acid biosynthesis glycosyltransferase